jgi:DNA invertase Pin-like site-specific DNA recombinase
MRYGYVRATRTTPGRTRQQAVLRIADCDSIVEERAGTGRLEEMGGLIARLRRGDCVVVARAGVLSGSYRRLLKIFSAIEAKGARIVTLESSCAVLPAGPVTLDDLRRAADTEHSAVSRSIRAGRQRARRRGVQLGRPAKMTPAQQQEAVESWLAGEKVGDIASRYGVSRTVITGLTAAIRHGAAATAKLEMLSAD